MPPPPGRFSITNCLPNAWASASLYSRAAVSAAPPGANGTMMRTGLVGHSCAGATFAIARLAANASAIDRQHIGPLPRRVFLLESLARLARFVAAGYHPASQPA